MEIKGRMTMMGLKKPKSTTPLPEERAVELGADILGEFFIYTVASITIAAEYWRHSRKESRHESAQQKKLAKLERSQLEHDLQIDTLRAEVLTLTRQLHHTQDILEKLEIKPKQIVDTKTGVKLKIEDKKN